MAVNKVILIGNVGADPEVRHLDSGVQVARIRLATTESYTNKNGEKVEQTEWHTVILWRGLAKIAEQYVSKGKQIYIEGKIRSRQWQDKDGNARYTTEIFAEQMQLLGRRSDSNGGGMPPITGEDQYSAGNQSTSAADEGPESPVDDDLPF